MGKITTVSTDCWFRRQRINLRVSKYTKGFRDDSLQLVLSEFYALNLIKIYTVNENCSLVFETWGIKTSNFMLWFPKLFKAGKSQMLKLFEI